MSYTAETISGEVTQYIPLTTTWTASSDCSRSFRQDGPSLVAFDPGYGLGIDSAVICQPPAVTTWWNQGLLGGGAADHTAVSIMPMTCPAGWSTVVTSVKDGVSTLAMCCPSGYYLANGVSGEVMGDCLSNVQRGMTLTYAWTSTSTDDWRIGTTTMTSSSTVGAIAVVGWNVKRTAVTATSSSTSSSTSSTVPAQTSSATPTGAAEMISDTATAASSITADSSEPLSSTTTALKAGIGIAVCLGVIGLIALVVAVWLLRRRKKAFNDNAERLNTTPSGTLDASSGDKGRGCELDPAERKEKRGDEGMVYELPVIERVGGMEVPGVVVHGPVGSALVELEGSKMA
ncbi:hypothetical protein K490DRAFT_49939 [Saccharata proteae CBS 121410]|uniref:Mid2 domain-containing protein n=1 Tax=Saccharata proteae CBS 121410 TaxID=1314787 RepID=A0A9P4HNK6_9PEZI|nr:hypothetical protein K490DRAFT_49939 [Saccharata proteae CBS 121410]